MVQTYTLATGPVPASRCHGWDTQAGYGVPQIPSLKVRLPTGYPQPLFASSFPFLLNSKDLHYTPFRKPTNHRYYQDYDEYLLIL